MILRLPYATLMPPMPDEEHGLIAGFYSFSRGIGILLGPPLAGLAISTSHPLLTSTQGYAAMWLVCGAAISASPALTRPIRTREAQLRRRRRSRQRFAQHASG